MRKRSPAMCLVKLLSQSKWVATMQLQSKMATALPRKLAAFLLKWSRSHSSWCIFLVKLKGIFCNWIDWERWNLIAVYHCTIPFRWGYQCSGQCPQTSSRGPSWGWGKDGCLHLASYSPSPRYVHPGGTCMMSVGASPRFSTFNINL